MKNGKEQDVLQQLTTEEKLSLTTGDGQWNTASVSRLFVLPVIMSDGPVGLRKVLDGETLPAVCFPSISKLACSFDPAVLREVGAAVGEQCRQENIQLLLAPGINIKRNPLCGRNFEYFSEDPLLTAELANAYIKGVNSQEVGVCIKHFAANSQEYARRVNDSIVDQRALREIYLAAFERVVKGSNPSAVMCAYNKLNGEYCTQNKPLIALLRNEWKYDGVVMTDWGATVHRVKGISAGVDLEMPQGDLSEPRRALENGSLWHSDLDKAVGHVLQLAQSFGGQTARNTDFEYQHNLVRRLSADCTVLAKNNCKLLPFDRSESVALIGALAATPHFQGGGSAKVNPYRVDSVKQAFADLGINFVYADGYKLDGTTEEMLEEARKAAASCDKVLLVVGDYGSETEGRDRTTLQLPSWQLQVIDAVTAANSNVAVAVQSGAPVDVSWHHSAKALILDYLSGENNASLADVVFGITNPTGRLAETWPIALPTHMQDYGKDYKRTLYKESIYVGYRYYTTAEEEVAFPFGHGLNYNEIVWSNVQLSNSSVMLGGKVSITLEMENLGTTEDADTVQIYATNLDGRNFYAKKNLVAFKKVRLKGGERKKVAISVDVADLASYDVESQSFVVNGGRYLLTVARNCLDSGFPLELYVAGENESKDCRQTLACYYDIDSSFCPTEQQFQDLYGEFPQEANAPFSLNSPLCETESTFIGKLLSKLWTTNCTAEEKRLLLATPLVDFVHFRRNLSVDMVKTLVDMLNGAVWKNLFKLFKQFLACRSKNKKK